jgi:hypothetical protein
MLTAARNAGSLAAMSNVLGDTKQQQVLALGRLGWSLRRIEEATTVRRETASAYLKAAGIPVRERGGRLRVWPPKTGHHTWGVHRPGSAKTGHHAGGVDRL